MDKSSKSDTIPKNIVLNDNSKLEHEASVSKISEDELLYSKTKECTKEEKDAILAKKVAKILKIEKIFDLAIGFRGNIAKSEIGK